MMLKFRTMHVDTCAAPGAADEALASLLRDDGDRRDEFKQQGKLKADPRVTTFGATLRRTSLDELPQLVNILRGDISLVGPRPLPVAHSELSNYGLSAHTLLTIRPGLTGFWQINGRSDVPYHERVRLDMAYIRSQSILLDLSILARTMSVVVRVPVHKFHQARRRQTFAPVVLSTESLGRATDVPRETVSSGSARRRLSGIQVLHVFEPPTGGVPRCVADMIADQLSAGLDVSVACPTETTVSQDLQAVGVRHYAWAANRGVGAHCVRETLSLDRIIRRAVPSIVHLHSAKAGLSGRIAIRGRELTVFQPHGWSFNAVEGRRRWLAERWEAFAARWAHAVICVSNDERHEGQSLGIRARWSVIPNGVRLERFSVASDTHRASARESLGLPAVPTVVCVGRLSCEKGQAVLLRRGHRCAHRIRTRC